MVLSGLFTYVNAGESVLQTDSSKPNNIVSQELVTKLVNHLAIDQGKGQFTQKKFFKFLTQPIPSNGYFTVSPQAILWQTSNPVFAQILVKNDAIYQRLSIREKYQPLVENAEFSTILTTIFKGEINSKDWSIDVFSSSEPSNLAEDNCLKLRPKNQQFTQLFERIEICLLEGRQRKIMMFDKHDNKTEILMRLNEIILDNKDLETLTL